MDRKETLFKITDDIVISEINNETIELRETQGDKAFTKGWGKMYLIR